MQRPDAHEQPDANGVLYDGEPHLDVGDWAGGQPAPKFRRRGPGSGAGDAGPAGVGAPPPADSQPHPEPNIWEAAGLPRPTDQTVVDLARFPLELHVPSRVRRAVSAGSVGVGWRVACGMSALCGGRAWVCMSQGYIQGV